MASACPICGGVSSKPRSPCARCTKRTASAADLATPASLDEDPASGPLPELDLPAPPPLFRPESSEAPRAMLDVPTGVADGYTPPPVTLIAVDAVQLLAAFGPSPRGPIEAVKYTMRVYTRLGEIREEREIARKKKPHEVPLYDAALKAYDENGFTLGLAVMGTVVVLALSAFLMPIVVRVVRAL